MIIKLVTACGCERVMSWPAERRPLEIVMNLMYPLPRYVEYNTLTSSKVDVSHRKFEFHHIDQDGFGYVYTYREAK